MERITRFEKETPFEWEFTKLDPWNQRLFVTLAKRYGLEPYRYRRQHRSTLIVKAPKPFLPDVFVPAFQRMGETLHEHLTEVADA